jgi:uncharacterized protein (DUF952 family)
MYIYHITSAKEWSEAQPAGVYQPANYTADGFIHCSFRDQVIKVANSYYRNANDMLLLKIDTDLVKSKIIEENLEGGEENFPHLYGQLPVSAVVQTAALPKDQNGYFSFPMQLD